MAIYYCPKCNRKYFLDDKEQNSKEFQQQFKCEFCGTKYTQNGGGTNTYVTNSQKRMP